MNALSGDCLKLPRRALRNQRGTRTCLAVGYLFALTTFVLHSTDSGSLYFCEGKEIRQSQQPFCYKLNISKPLIRTLDDFTGHRESVSGLLFFFHFSRATKYQHQRLEVKCVVFFCLVQNGPTPKSFTRRLLQGRTQNLGSGG